MKQVSEAQILYDTYEEFEGFSISNWENYLKRAVRDAVGLIGMPAEHFLQSKEVLVESDGTFSPPENAQHLWAILLVDKEGNAQEPAFLRPSTPMMHQDALVKIPYTPTAETQVPAVRYDPSARCFFIENWNYLQRVFLTAHISFTGLSFNDEGEVMIPEDATVAIKAYLALKVMQRLRKRNGSTITQGDVSEALDYWYRMAGDAKGKLRATTRPRMQELVREEWYRSRFVTPYRRIGR